MIVLLAFAGIGFVVALCLYIATDILGSATIATMLGLAPRVAHWRRISHRFAVVTAVMLILFLVAEVVR